MRPVSGLNFEDDVVVPRPFNSNILASNIFRSPSFPRAMAAVLNLVTVFFIDVLYPISEIYSMHILNHYMFPASEIKNHHISVVLTCAELNISTLLQGF